jgi:hypothetical protein
MTPSEPRLISRRAVLIGLALIPFNVFLVVRLEWALKGPYFSTISLFPNAVFALLLLIAANALLRRWKPRLAFHQAELMTIYLMVAVSTGLAGVDGVPILNQMIPHGAWYGTNGGKWSEFLDAFPAWMVIKDPEAIRGHYIGNSTFYTLAHLRAWTVPILVWTAFITLLLWTAMCLNVLVRRQWQDRERLSFPIVWLPMEMTEPGGTLFRNRLMWAGFAIAVLVGLYNGIAYLYPSFPSLPIRSQDLKPYFTSKPWNAIDWFPITLYPFVIGLGYLLPKDLLFSCWFFFLCWKGQLVLANVYAYDTTPGFPYIREQGFGALMGLAVFYLWTGRRSLAEAWRIAFGKGRAENRDPGIGDSGSTTSNTEQPVPTALRSSPSPEALSYRAAFLGMAGGLAGLAAFFLAAGVSLWLTATCLAIYFAIIFVINRIRAELGPPVHDFHFIGPDRMLPRAIGVSGWRHNDLAMLTMFWSFNRAHRGDTAPVGLEGLYMAHKRQWEPGRMFGAFMAAVVVSTLCAFWLHEHHAYERGETSKFLFGSWAAGEAYEKMAGWVGGSQDANFNPPAVMGMGVGMFASLALLWVRLRFLGFPLHPIGYAVSSSWSIHLLWLPLLIAWLLKSWTLRWGGMRGYRLLQPFFLGIILGDCVQGCFWALASLALNTRTYSFFGE